MTMVGEDEFGYMLADILKQNNVDNSGVRFDHNARTALAFVTLRSDGEREFLFFRNPSADMLFHESELDLDLIKKAKIFHYGSISLIDEPCRSTHLAAMAVAKKSGCILSYDPNLRLPLWPSADAARKGIMSIWDQADVIKITEEEISFLTGGDDPYDDNVVLKKLLHTNLKLLLVSEGPEGCRYYTKQFKGRVPAVKVKAVDTTGAGDAFVGGILQILASDIKLCVAGGFLEPEIVHYNPKEFDFGKKKAFPFPDQFNGKQEYNRAEIDDVRDEWALRITELILSATSEAFLSQPRS